MANCDHTPYKRDEKAYTFPPIDLLDEDKFPKLADHSKEDETKIGLLRETLALYEAPIQNDIVFFHGPTFTRYEVKPAKGSTANKIMSCKREISLAMYADVRIEPVPGKQAVAIEIPNNTRKAIYLRTLLEAKTTDPKKPLEFPLGVDAKGETVACNLTQMPHLLVAGATSTGKSTFLHSMLISLLYQASPRDLRLILIDPKQVEFSAYEDIPHLCLPIITQTREAVDALSGAIWEMERRYGLMRQAGVRKIEEYNAKTKDEPLPYLLIVIDELADLKLGPAAEDIDDHICRLAQKSRAAGIHLVIGTQHPRPNVFSGVVKSNIPARIAFKVSTQEDSRTILDGSGAEYLCGRGDMLYLPTSQTVPTRLQCTFISNQEAISVASYVRGYNAPVEYNEDF